MEKWIELTNRQRVNEWAAVNGNEQAPPTQAPNARGKSLFHSNSTLFVKELSGMEREGVSWLDWVVGYGPPAAIGN